MPDELSDAEAKLKQLAERLRQGWAVRHPVSEETVAAVRQAVKQQWEQQKKQGPAIGDSTPPPPTEKPGQERAQQSQKTQDPPKPPAKKTRDHSKDQDWGHGH